MVQDENDRAAPIAAQLRRPSPLHNSQIPPKLAGFPETPEHPHPHEKVSIST